MSDVYPLDKKTCHWCKRPIFHIPLLGYFHKGPLRIVELFNKECVGDYLRANPDNSGWRQRNARLSELK